MKTIVDKMRIIGLKESGYSMRRIARELGCDRKTVTRYWEKYCAEKELLTQPGTDIKELQEEMCGAPKYDVGNRKRGKRTDEIINRLKELLLEEAEKDRKVGKHKQQRTKNSFMKYWYPKALILACRQSMKRLTGYERAIRNASSVRNMNWGSIWSMTLEK